MSENNEINRESHEGLELESEKVKADHEVVEAVNTDNLDNVKAEIAALKASLHNAEAKAEENYNLALRTKAEAENVVRRAERDVANAHKFGIEKFALELLPVIDSLELGLAAASDDKVTVEKFREGSEMTLKMFQTALEKFGVQVVNPQGEKFNPELHQAMTMQENNDVEPNTVLNVFQKGYTLQGRIMRPAMVVVSKATTSPPQNSQIDEMA